MSYDPTMTQALDLPTECLATGLTSLTSLSSSAPLSPPSSQFDINNFWEDDDVLPFTPVDESSMFDLVDESTDGLASRRPVLQLGPTDPNIEVESATALKELVESKIGAGAQLLSPEAGAKTPCDQSQHAAERYPDPRPCDTTQGALALLLMHRAQPSDHPLSQDTTGQRSSASSTKQGLVPAQSSKECDSNEAEVETGSLRSEHSPSQEPEVLGSASPADPSSCRNDPLRYDHPGPMEVIMDRGIPTCSLDSALPSSTPNDLGSNDHGGPTEAVVVGRGSSTCSAHSPLPSSAPKEPGIINDHTGLEELTTDQGSPAPSSVAVPSSDPPNDHESNDHNGAAEAATIGHGQPASPTDLCARSGDSTDGNFVPDPIQGEGSATPQSDHCEVTCDSLDSNRVSAAAPPRVSSCKVSLASGTPSTNGYAQQETPAVDGGESRSRSMSQVNQLSHDQRRGSKQVVFRIPRGLPEAPSLSLSRRSKRKRSLSSGKGSSKGDPICVDDSDEDHESSRMKRSLNEAHPARTKPIVPQKVVETRSKRRRGEKPNYIQWTDLEITTRFEDLEKKWSELRSNVDELREEQEGFQQYLQEMGYGG